MLISWKQNLADFFYISSGLKKKFFFANNFGYSIRAVAPSSEFGMVVILVVIT